MTFETLRELMSCGLCFDSTTKLSCIIEMLARLQIKQIGIQFSRYQNYKSIPVRWKSYRAAILEEFDKPLVVTKIKNETPLGMSMIRMSVDYCSLNIADVNKLSSKNNSDETLLPTIPGCEFSGEVTEVGDFVVENIKKGDKVVAILGNCVD